MTEIMQLAPAVPAPSNPADVSQDIEMTDGHVGSPSAQHSAVPSQPTPNPEFMTASTQPPSHAFQPAPVTAQPPTNAPQQVNPPQPANMSQQMPLPPVPKPNVLPPPNQANFTPVNQANNHVPGPVAQPSHQMQMSSIPVSLSSQSIAGYYSEMPANSQNSDGFELVSDGGGMLSANRIRKKDVKRRTKTGCLTCRKRRIKCDERHPVCRNCEKSKRECLGYDPVFRSQPGPSALQPAPFQTSFPVAAPQTPQPASAPPNAVQVVSEPPSHSPSLPAATPSVASPSSEQPNQTPNVNSVAAAVESPSVPGKQESYQHLLMANAIPECRNLELKRINIDDLLMISGQLDPFPEGVELSSARTEECANFFMPYATCADVFLESHWFEANARPFLLANKELLAHLSAFLDSFMERKWTENPELVPIMESREARIVWDTMTLCRAAQAQNINSDSKTVPEDPDLTLAINRLKVVEALITGQILKTNPTSAPEYAGEEPAWSAAGLAQQLKRREMKFWDAMGQYLVITDDMPECDVLRDLTLMDARAYLDLIENRDVLYSIAVIRHISRFQPRRVKNLPPSTDEKDVSAKLYVATKFIEEERDGKATNQLIRRLCAQLLRWWESPENL
ncbi:hypothetical protein PRK78_006213 [Emydomyces testavorans]|uniref:Zn(2)-C6 fungal-type domain-containing protein n=1 Tax=Emydomyces testavorans TaxID=2070801 RepID=A0AAF0DNS6_9EURO|nr:hypothetical protein PRK78_006213 [Emydomyces testavorans]